MRITTKGRYALRAVLSMASNGSDKPVSIRSLSEQESLSPVFLEQLFHKLRKADIVHSVRGPGGGFLFARPIEDISVYDILSAVGELTDLAPCTDPGEACVKHEDCIACTVWSEASLLVKNHLSNTSLAKILKRGNADL